MRIAIFASGTGSNAQAILTHLDGNAQLQVGLILSNRPEPGVKQHAETFGVPFIHLSRSEFNEPDRLLGVLESHNINGIVLAGFLLLLPGFLVEAFEDRILNIHPALLPAYGGKGMYGMHVHKAVKANKESLSGITIHKVNKEYDKGKILFQASVALDPEDTAEEIGGKVLKLEHRYYPRVVEDYFIHLGK